MSIDSWLQTVAEQGLLGILLLISGFAIVKLYMKQNELNEARLSDAKEKLDLAERVFAMVDKLSDLMKKNGGSNV
jgi:hypothetical protein